ncbi:hypothetical protein OHA10_28100 [Kribbella sp. NBC_00662]|uniref:hypothetical protein n=1 Tax=Kribbella sp. NBC_00662 TaxID=2975969 RepID=UPI003244A13A
MTANQAIVLTGIFGLCFVVVKNPKATLKIGVALTLAAALFGVYIIVGAARGLNTDHSDVDPARVQADHRNNAASSPTPQPR